MDEVGLVLPKNIEVDDGPDGEGGWFGSDKRLIFCAQVAIGGRAEPSGVSHAIDQDDVQDVGDEVDVIFAI